MPWPKPEPAAVWRAIEVYLARAYPGGFVVDVAGGAAAVDGDRVAVTADHAGADVDVVIRPAD